jgi:hypothetical protein
VAALVGGGVFPQAHYNSGPRVVAGRSPLPPRNFSSSFEGKEKPLEAALFDTVWPREARARGDTEAVCVSDSLLRSLTRKPDVGRRELRGILLECRARVGDDRSPSTPAPPSAPASKNCKHGAA